MLPFNHSVFLYCDSNIGLFSIAPCKLINFNQFFASFLMALSLQLSLFLALKGDSEKITVTFR